MVDAMQLIARMQILRCTSNLLHLTGRCDLHFHLGFTRMRIGKGSLSVCDAHHFRPSSHYAIHHYISEIGVPHVVLQARSRYRYVTSITQNGFHTPPEHHRPPAQMRRSCHKNALHCYRRQRHQSIRFRSPMIRWALQPVRKTELVGGSPARSRGRWARESGPGASVVVHRGGCRGVPGIDSTGGLDTCTPPPRLSTPAAG